MKFCDINVYNLSSNAFIQHDLFTLHSQSSDVSAVRRGGYLIPALMDIHTHSDFYLDSNQANQYARDMGVTAQVGGLCGFHAVFDEANVSRESYEEYASFLGTKTSIFNSFDGLFSQINQADKQHLQLLGINSYLFSYPITEATDLDQYVATLSGIFHRYPFVGISVGLSYHPVKTLEPALFNRFMTKLVHVIPTVYNYHVRNQNVSVFDSLEEVFAYHEGSQSHCHISHLKFAGATHIGKVKERFVAFKRRIEQADFPVTWDVYPFHFACTTISTFLPESDSWSKMQESEVVAYLKDNPPFDFSNVVIACADLQFNGLTLSEIAHKLDVSVERAYYQVVTTLKGIGSYFRDFSTIEDLAELIYDEQTMIASDSLGIENVHPRCTHTFTKVLACAYHQGPEAFLAMVNKLTSGPQKVFPQATSTTGYLYIQFDNDRPVNLASSVEEIDAAFKAFEVVTLPV